MKPTDVNRCNAQDVWKTSYGRNSKPIKQKFNLGAPVKISKHKRIFEKGYLPSWTEETFTIAQRFPRDLPVYRLKEAYGDFIQGKLQTTCFVLKKLFPPRRFLRSISLNAHYIIAFDNPRDTLGLRTSTQQAFAGHFPYVWKSFQDTTLQPYVYLVMDLHRRTPITLRLQNNILPLPQSYPVVVVNKKTHTTDGPLPINFSQHQDYV